jgi:hypothetical protein
VSSAEPKNTVSHTCRTAHVFFTPRGAACSPTAQPYVRAQYTHTTALSSLHQLNLENHSSKRPPPAIAALHCNTCATDALLQPTKEQRKNAERMLKKLRERKSPKVLEGHDATTAGTTTTATTTTTASPNPLSPRNASPPEPPASATSPAASPAAAATAAENTADQSKPKAKTAAELKKLRARFKKKAGAIKADRAAALTTDTSTTEATEHTPAASPPEAPVEPTEAPADVHGVASPPQKSPAASPPARMYPAERGMSPPPRTMPTSAASPPVSPLAPTEPEPVAMAAPNASNTSSVSGDAARAGASDGHDAGGAVSPLRGDGGGGAQDADVAAASDADVGGAATGGDGGGDDVSAASAVSPSAAGPSAAEAKKSPGELRKLRAKFAKKAGKIKEKRASKAVTPKVTLGDSDSPGTPLPALPTSAAAPESTPLPPLPPLSMLTSVPATPLPSLPPVSPSTPVADVTQQLPSLPSSAAESTPDASASHAAFGDAMPSPERPRFNKTWESPAVSDAGADDDGDEDVSPKNEGRWLESYTRRMSEKITEREAQVGPLAFFAVVFLIVLCRCAGCEGCCVSESLGGRGVPGACVHHS